MTEEAEKFQPVLIWQRDPYRIVQVDKEKFVVELGRKDAMGNDTWQHHLNVQDSPGGGATQILWIMLMTPKGVF
jgi:hypothetical protein